MTIKKVFLLVVCVCVCIVCSTYAADISVSVNGEPLICDASPVIRNDRVLVPMRTVFEALGCDVSWNPEEYSVSVEYIKSDFFAKNT